MATRYWLEGPGVESRVTSPFQTCSGVHKTSVQWVPGPFPVVKRPGRGVEPPPPLYLAPRLKKDQSCTSTPPSGPSCTVPGRYFIIFPVISFMQNIYNCILETTHISGVYSPLQQEEGSFYQHIGLGIEEEARELLHLEHSFIWC